jgi:hypothetical protein
MIAGTLASSGYWTGARQWAGTDANPKGFFEDREVNAINEALLSTVTPWVPRGRLGRWWPGRLGDLQRWLALVADDAEVRSSPMIDARIAAAVQSRPFAIKDPRFCVTLSAWRPHLPADTGFIVVFREPARTVASLRHEVGSAGYLRQVQLSEHEAETLWQQSYRRVLDLAGQGGDWLFVHYEQALAGGGLDRLGDFLGADIDRRFVDENLRRSADDGIVADESGRIYAALCERAGYAHVG